MKKIISASRKEDIIKNKKRYDILQEILSDGFYESDNMFRGHTINVFNTEDVGAVILWSKDYQNFLDNPGILDNYNLYFQFTITGYTKNQKAKIEPNVIHYKLAIEQMKQLANKYGADTINWRFDPIAFFKNMVDKPQGKLEIIKERLDTFEELCEAISAIGVKRCTISFISLYDAVKRRLKALNIEYIELNEEEQIEFLNKLVNIATKYNIQLYACSSPLILKVPEIKKSSCIDGEVLSKLYKLKFSKAKDNGQRKDCGCVKSIDVGRYLPCPHSCVYCYGVTR